MKLVNQGRAKAYGVSWNEEEAIARSKGVSAEDIRSGDWKKVEEPKEELKEEPKVEEKAEEKVEEPKAKRVRKPKK